MHAGRKRRHWLGLAACSLLLAIAALARVRAAQNDLWLDEIWSVNLAGRISSPLQVLTGLHHDNNHYLNTLFIHLSGAHGNWPGYRIPSLVAGIGTVALAGLLGLRRSRVSAFMAILVTACSYVLILYSSEARGYACVVFFSFLSYHLLESHLERQNRLVALSFSVSAIAGFLSHLVFLNFYIPAFFWSAYRLIRSPLGARKAVTAIGSCHGLPVLSLAALYFVDVRHMAVGGANPLNLFDGYASSLAAALGAPAADPIRPFALIAGILVLGSGILLLWHERSDSWIFYVGSICVVPLALGVVSDSVGFYVRYFIVGIAFLLILLSFLLESLYRRGFRGKAACVVLLAGYCAANAWQVATLFQYGRGQYQEAVRFLVEHTKRARVTVGSDHDNRTLMTLEFFRGAMGSKVGKYFRQDSWPPEGPEWVIRHAESFESSIPGAALLTDGSGNQYELVQTFPAAPLSGVHWYIYHNRAD